MPKATRTSKITRIHLSSARSSAAKPAFDAFNPTTDSIAQPESAPLPVQITKKEKQTSKHEALLRRLDSVTPHKTSKSHQRRLKRKANEQLGAGENNSFGDLQAALASVDPGPQPVTIGDSLAETSSSGDTKKESTKKKQPKTATIGEGKAAPLSQAQRKKALELERLRHPLILQNPDFTTNPFQTIRAHALNTLVKHDAQVPEHENTK